MLKKCIDMQNNIPLPPLYDGKESTIRYERRVSEYIARINSLKYDIILEFLNIYTSNKYTKLKDFKNLDESIFIDHDHNKYMYETYSVQLNEHLSIVKSEILFEDGKINFISYIQKILSKIGYIMIKKKNDKYAIFLP